MYEKTLVSVLIPAYNHENYIQETIKSIINQTYKNIELIIIDDGSKDNTWQKIQQMKEECERRFARVYFETKENEGTCKTLNKLLDLAQGEYVYLIASDDMAKPEAIETEINFLSKHKDYALCVGDNEIIDSEGKSAYWDENRNLVYDVKDSKYFTFADFLKHERSDVNFNSDDFGKYPGLYIGNYVPNGYLIRKNIYDKIGYYTPEAPCEDYWFMLQISKYAKLKYIDKVLFSYRWHNSNTIKSEKAHQNDIKTRETEEKILKNLDLKLCLPNISDFVKYGELYKKSGIKYLFEISKYKNREYKTKKIKFLFKTFILRKRI